MIYKKLLILAGALFPISLVAVSFIYPAFTGEDSQWFGFNRLTVAELGEIPFVAVCMFALVFILLRTNTLNQDGSDLLWKIPADVERIGVHVVHDEMLELVIHSLFWRLLLLAEGSAGVSLSYRIVSVLSGVVFVNLLADFCRTHIKSHRFFFMVSVLSGGYILLFFGDVENYSMTAAMVMWYILVSSRALAAPSGSARHLYSASILLGTAMCFHLQAVLLVPSLVYLAFRTSPRSWKAILPPVLIPFLITGLCMLILDLTGILPLEHLWIYSHATAHGGDIGSVLPPLSKPYYLEMLNLMVLLFPSVVLLPFVPALAEGNRAPIVSFLSVALCPLLLLPLGWKAALGVLNDWNLYAIVAVPGSVLVWYVITEQQDIKKGWLMPFVFISFLSTFMWIWQNHAPRG